ncbi:MAG: hypothetical protein ACR2PO_02920 [Methyloligellaceae bacterium]
MIAKASQHPGHMIVEISPRGICTPALETALKLARAYGLEIEGLFVEDEDLIALAQMPFSCEVQVISGQIRVLEPRQIEADFRLIASATRREFERGARAAALTHRFRVVRETAARAVEREARSAELVFLAELTARARRQADLQRLILDQSQVTDLVFFGPNARAHSGPVLVVLDEDTRYPVLAEHALKVATSETTDIGIVMLGEPSRRLTDVTRQFQAKLPVEIPHWVVHEPSNDPGAVARVASRKTASLLIVDARSRWTSRSDHLTRLILHSGSPVLVAGRR